MMITSRHHMTSMIRTETWSTQSSTNLASSESCLYMGEIGATMRVNIQPDKHMDTVSRCEGAALLCSMMHHANSDHAFMHYGGQLCGRGLMYQSPSLVHARLMFCRWPISNIVGGESEDTGRTRRGPVCSGGSMDQYPSVGR